MSDINTTKGVGSGSEASTNPSTPKTWPKSYYENPKNRDGPLRHDIETYSPEDLTECGVYVYSAHPDFDILLCAFAYGDGPVEVLDLVSGQPFPPWLEDDLKNPAVTKSAYNAMFERTCWSAYFHTYISPEGWVCTMIQAASVSYPFSLEKCGEALGTDVQKDKRGKDLIKLFSVPHKRRKKHLDGTITEEFYRVYPQDAPEDWEVFKEYNRVDVETERSIANMLKDYPLEGYELELYHLDQRINDRGILVDRVLVEEAIHCDEVYSQELRDKAIKLTGINNPNSPLQFRAWLEGRGCMIDSMGKKQVAEVMDKMAEQVRAGQGDPVVLEALRIRQQISKSSIKKYMAAERFMCQDDRFRGGFQFYGANHTGRWSGRGLQLQNLARNSLETLDIARSFLREGNLEALELIYDNVPDVLSQLVRTMFIPKPGCRLIVADFSAIEARALAWVSQEEWRLQAFSEGQDIYCASASRMFGVPVVKHGENGHLRQRGKIAELALGYGGSSGALESMGALDKKYGLTKDELPDLVKTWRESNGNITKFWWDVDKAATKAFETGREQWVANICIGYFDNKLQIKLPSGRILYYVNPGRIMNQFGQLNLAYDGVGQNKKWSRIPTYGPKLVENCIGEGTLVVTSQGLTPIEHITDDMLIWDGENWVSHEGLIYQGVQETVSVNGIHMTPDHKILTEEGWKRSAESSGLDWAPTTLPNGRVFSPCQVKYEKSGEAKVYDIRNCGPRHRFAVWNGERALIVSNCIQGICRDILADAMLRVEAAGYDIVAHVHDEIICEVPIGVSSVDEICSLMSQLPDWADSTLPLNADGYECEYYKKD